MNISKSSMKQRLFLQSKSVPLPPVVDTVDDDDHRDDENDTSGQRLSNDGQSARDPPSPLPLVLSSPLPILSSVQSFALSSRPGSTSENRGSGTTMVLVDNGTPSSSPLYDLKQVLKLIQDKCHLVANELYMRKNPASGFDVMAGESLMNSAAINCTNSFLKCPI